MSDTHLTNSVVDFVVMTEDLSPFRESGDGHWAAFANEKGAVEHVTKKWKGAAVYRRVTRWFSDGTSREMMERLPK